MINYHGINCDYIIILTIHFIVDTMTELVRIGRPPITIAVAPSIKIMFKFRLVNLTILYMKSQWRPDVIFCFNLLCVPVYNEKTETHKNKY